MRYKACVDDKCGFEVWIDPPLGARSVKVIKEMQMRIVETLDKWRHKKNMMI